jgi:hypothetical protein
MRSAQKSLISSVQFFSWKVSSFSFFLKFMIRFTKELMINIQLVNIP